MVCVAWSSCIFTVLNGTIFFNNNNNLVILPNKQYFLFVPLFLSVVLIKSPYLIGLIIFIHQKMCAVICVDIFRSHSV